MRGAGFAWPRAFVSRSGTRRAYPGASPPASGRRGSLQGARRISVVKDAELAAALEAARDLLGTGSSEAALVRQLAILGAREALQVESRRQSLLQELVEETTSPDWPYMSEAQIDREAWGIESAER